MQLDLYAASVAESALVIPTAPSAHRLRPQGQALGRASDMAGLHARSQWYVARLSAGSAATNVITKGPGFLDPRYPDGGTPITYPGAGTSFLLPLRPPYTSATVVMCGGSCGNFNYDRAPAHPAALHPCYYGHARRQLRLTRIQVVCMHPAPMLLWSCVAAPGLCSRPLVRLLLPG